MKFKKMKKKFKDKFKKSSTTIIVINTSSPKKKKQQRTNYPEMYMDDVPDDASYSFNFPTDKYWEAALSKTEDNLIMTTRKSFTTKYVYNVNQL